MAEIIIAIATLSAFGCWALVAVGSVADAVMRDHYEQELHNRNKEQTK